MVVLRVLAALLLVGGVAVAQPTPPPGCSLSGCTYSGPVHMGANTIDGSAVAFTGGTLTGLTVSGGTFSGTIAGTPTFSGNYTSSGNPTFSGAQINFNTILKIGSNTVGQIAQLNGTAASPSTLQWANAGVKQFQLNIDASANLQAFTYDASGITPIQWLKVTKATGAIDWQTVPTFHTPLIVQPNVVTFSGSDGGTPGTTQTLFMNETLAGSTTSSTNVVFNRFFVAADNLATPNVSGGADMFRFDLNFGGNAINGGRRGIAIIMNQVGDMPAQNNTAGFVVFQPKINVTGQAGTGQFPYLESMNPACTIEGTASNWAGCTVIESDMYVKSGTSVLVKGFQFWHLTPDDAVQGTQDDAFLVADSAPSVGATNTVGTMRNLFQIMKHGATQWPLDASAGSLITVGTQTIANANGAPVRPNAMLRGFDFHNINMTDSVAWWPGGWLGGGGEARFGRLKISKGTNGPALDASLYKATGCGVSVSGAGYQAGDQVYPVGMAGVINIDTAPGGNVTGCSWVADREAYSTTNPATSATSGGSGNQNFVATITWAAATEMQIGASVNTIVGTGAALATNATSGLLQIPTMAGAPTGTIGALGKAAVVIDTTNKKLCYSTGSGVWECSAAFTP